MTAQSHEEKLELLAKLNEQALAGGGEKRVERQHAAGKLTARERIELLLDPGSFVELDRLVTHRCTDFGMEKTKHPGDGGGHRLGHRGRVAKPVCSPKTSLSLVVRCLRRTLPKICKVMDLATKVGAPIVGLCDSGGARIQEGVRVARWLLRTSSCATRSPAEWCRSSAPSWVHAPGARVYSPAITDFVLMVDKTSYMFITGPEVTKTVTGEEVTKEQLGGSATHASKSGVCHFTAPDDAACIMQLRDLLSYLPSNNAEQPPRAKCTDPVDRDVQELDTMIPTASSKPYDMKKVVKAVVDDGGVA